MRRIACACAAALLIATAAPPSFAQNVGDPAPDFTLETWFNGTGEKSLGDFQGKLILVEIWATW